MIRKYRVSIDVETERGCTSIDREGTHTDGEGVSIGYEIGLDIAVLIEQLASDLTQKEHDDVHKAVSEYHVNFPKRTLESQMDTHIAVQEAVKRCCHITNSRNGYHPQAIGAAKEIMEILTAKESQ